MVRVWFLEKKIVKVKNYDDIRAFDGIYNVGRYGTVPFPGTYRSGTVPYLGKYIGMDI